MWVGGHPHHGGRRGPGGHPDRHQADAGLLLDRARGLPADGRRASRTRDGLVTSSGGAVLPGRVRLHRRSPRSPSSRWSGTPTARRPTCRRWAGLGKRSPLLAGIFAFFLLAFAGIPLTSGFTGKFAVFAAALPAAPGRWSWSACCASGRGVLLRAGDRDDVLLRAAGRRPDRGLPGAAHLGRADRVGVAATLVLGVVPGPLLDLAAKRGEFIR